MKGVKQHEVARAVDAGEVAGTIVELVEVLLLIPEVVFAEHEVGQMLWQPSGLKYFHLKKKEGSVFNPDNSKNYSESETQVPVLTMPLTAGFC